MGYEVLLFHVPGGADVEETGEALMVRLARGHEPTRLTDSGRAQAERLARGLVAADADLSAAPTGDDVPPGAVELRAASGLVVAVTDRYARFLVPFALYGDAADAAFRQLFALLAVAAQATGWRPYDPQEGEAVALDDAARETVLEIYLSVMDQLRPGDGVAGSATA